MSTCFDFQIADLTLQENYVLSDTVGELTGNEDWIQLTPAPDTATGKIRGRDGRSFKIASGVVDAFNASGEEFFVDIEHLTERGLSRDVIGWVKKLAHRNGGEVWGLTKWNKLGAKILEDGSFRSTSPVIKPTMESFKNVQDKKQDFYDAESFRSVAVTNRPNLHVRSLHTEKNIMRDKLLETLQLNNNASEGEILLAVQDLKHTSVNIDKFVPRADYDSILLQMNSLQSSLETIRMDRHAEKVNQALSAAVRDGKINPASIDYHRECASTEEGLERFMRFVEKAPQIIQEHSQFEDKQEPVLEFSELTEQQKKICANMDIPTEVFIQQLKSFKEKSAN